MNIVLRIVPGPLLLLLSFDQGARLLLILVWFLHRGLEGAGCSHMEQSWFLSVGRQMEENNSQRRRGGQVDPQMRIPRPFRGWSQEMLRLRILKSRMEERQCLDMVKLPHCRITKFWPQRNRNTHGIQKLNPDITNSEEWNFRIPEHWRFAQDLRIKKLVTQTLVITDSWSPQNWKLKTHHLNLKS